MMNLPALLASAAQATQHAGTEIAQAADHEWSHQLIMGSVDICIVVIGISMLLCIIRLIQGPHLADRALAVDTLGIMLIAFVILLSIRLQTLIFFDGILILSLLSFAGTVAMAQYIGRPHTKKLKQQKQPDASSTN